MLPGLGKDRRAGGHRKRAPGKGTPTGTKLARRTLIRRDTLTSLAGAEKPCDRATGEERAGGAYLKELHGHEAEPLLLEALDDVAHQAALHAVRLDGDEGALHTGHGPKGEWFG